MDLPSGDPDADIAVDLGHIRYAPYGPLPSAVDGAEDLSSGDPQRYTAVDVGVTGEVGCPAASSDRIRTSSAPAVDGAVDLPSGDLYLDLRIGPGPDGTSESPAVDGTVHGPSLDENVRRPGTGHDGVAVGVPTASQQESVSGIRLTDDGRILQRDIGGRHGYPVAFVPVRDAPARHVEHSGRTGYRHIRRINDHIGGPSSALYHECAGLTGQDDLCTAYFTGVAVPADDGLIFSIRRDRVHLAVADHPSGDEYLGGSYVPAAGIATVDGPVDPQIVSVV